MKAEFSNADVKSFAAFMSAVEGAKVMLDIAMNIVNEQAARNEKRKTGRKAKKEVREKQKNETITYTLRRGQKGPVPKWVLKQAGAKNKADLLAFFEDGKVFTLA